MGGLSIFQIVICPKLMYELSSNGNVKGIFFITLKVIFNVNVEK